MYKINDKGIELIKSFEGIEDGDPTTVNLDPYVDVAGIYTIGWGHAIRYKNKLLTIKKDPDGKIAKFLYPYGLTLLEAEELLRSDITDTEVFVRRAVGVDLTSNQFSALVSFTFNVGVFNLLNSTLLKKLNNKDYIGAANEFPKWRKAGGKILNGLVRRRVAEMALFLNNN